MTTVTISTAPTGELIESAGDSGSMTVTTPTHKDTLTDFEWSTLTELVSLEVQRLDYLLDSPTGYRHLACLVELREIERKLNILSAHLVEVK